MSDFNTVLLLYGFLKGQGSFLFSFLPTSLPPSFPFFLPLYHSFFFNLFIPFKVQKCEDIIDGVTTYGVDSTPADCVRVAQYYLMEEFDIVFSGINNGYNLGEDILYSGTIGAASEAVLCGKKAIAFSTARNSYDNTIDEFSKVFKLIEENQLLDIHDLWNINVCDSPLGVKFTTQGNTHFDAYYEELGNNDIFSRGGPDLSIDDDKSSDVCAIYNHYISITPLTIDRTAHSILKKINNN